MPLKVHCEIDVLELSVKPSVAEVNFIWSLYQRTAIGSQDRTYKLGQLYVLWANLRVKMCCLHLTFSLLVVKALYFFSYLYLL